MIRVRDLQLNPGPSNTNLTGSIDLVASYQKTNVTKASLTSKPPSQASTNLAALPVRSLTNMMSKGVTNRPATRLSKPSTNTAAQASTNKTVGIPSRTLRNSENFSSQTWLKSLLAPPRIQASSSLEAEINADALVLIQRHPIPEGAPGVSDSSLKQTRFRLRESSRASLRDNNHQHQRAASGFITTRLPGAPRMHYPTSTTIAALRGGNPNAAQIPGNLGVAPPSPTQTPPGLPTTRTAYSSTNVTISGEEVNLNFLPNTPLEAVFDTYSRLTGRTVLRPNTLPGLVTIKTLTPLTREEAIEALNSVFALNGIVMISVGKSFVKAVPPTTAPGEGTPFSEKRTADMPEGDHYVTQIVKIKNALAADVAKAIAPLSKTPNQVVAIEASQTIILRDLASVVKRMMEVIKRSMSRRNRISLRSSDQIRQ
jgi:hypothetical protein